MSDQIGKALVTAMTAAHLEGPVPKVVSGMLIDRPRPANSGWCGNENCLHKSHKHFNSPAKSKKG
jgi:hypothetical protein